MKQKKDTTLLFKYDQEKRLCYSEKTGTNLKEILLCGVDEAGRGPLAGDVFAAAVILPLDYFLQGLNDSKKLSPKQREKCYFEIKENALSISVCQISTEKIEKINILNATLVAMEKAIFSLNKKSETLPEIILIDGNKCPEKVPTATAIIKGDTLSQTIAAASVIAKFERDLYMEEMDKIYPGYGFANNKGYGTKQHYEAIKKLGLCEIHRKSFIHLENHITPQNIENSLWEF